MYDMEEVNDFDDTKGGGYLANLTFSYQEDGRPNHPLPEAMGKKQKQRYYPCYDLEGFGSQFLQNPEENISQAPEINIIEPLIITTCTPRVVRYYITIAHAGGNQEISYQMRDEGSNLEYHRNFDVFDGDDLDEWTKLSDTAILYDVFRKTLSVGSSIFADIDISDIGTPMGHYKLPNGTVVETCEIESGNWFSLAPGMRNEANAHSVLEKELWDNSIFGRRNPTDSFDRIKFDPELVKDVLAKTTISALSLNGRYDMVNGTETRAFNIYRFQRKLPFFLPYTLSLGLAIPIIALGLLTLYIQNNGVSAITGGFVQVLMTTTGRTLLEAVIAKGSRSMGGAENVSKELSDMEIRFGELIEEDGESSTESWPSKRHQRVQYNDAERYDVDVESSQDGSGYTMVATVMEGYEEGATVRRRAGFGTLDETRPFGKGT
jgi:hypothetical protein